MADIYTGTCIHVKFYKQDQQETITKVLIVLKEDRATRRSPTRTRRSKTEDEH
jgi:hypothetical protein